MLRSKGFTLIELLIVIAIIAVLAVTVVLTLNPSELLRQARDSNRMGNLADINKALALYQTEFSSASIGTSSIVYVSLPDSSATCANIGLPALPSGWAYSCATSSLYRNVNGTGWIPVNFTALSGGSLFNTLPTDPVNTTSNGMYFYTFVVSGNTWEIAAGLEASKNTAIAVNDGGTSLASLERGTNLSLTPQVIEENQRDSTLIGYWAFEETSGLSAQDWSKNNYVGNLTAGITRHTSSTCKFSGCIYLNGTNDQVIVSSTNSRLQPPLENTVSVWFKLGPTFDAYDAFFGFAGNVYDARMDSTSYIRSHQIVGGTNYYIDSSGMGNLQDGNWHHYLKTFSQSDGRSRVYIDGVVRGGRSDIGGAYLSSFPYNLAIGSRNGTSYFNGYIDEFRYYNRALSASEIQALYTGGQ